jgi:hypothetical protein
MAKIIHPSAVLRRPLRPPFVEEVDELSFLLGNYAAPVPSTARKLILERAFNADRRAADRRKRPSKKPAP